MCSSLTVVKASGLGCNLSSHLGRKLVRLVALFCSLELCSHGVEGAACLEPGDLVLIEGVVDLCIGSVVRAGTRAGGSDVEYCFT